MVSTLARIKARRPSLGVLENVLGMSIVRGDASESALCHVKQRLTSMGYHVEHTIVDLSIFHAATRARTLEVRVA